MGKIANRKPVFRTKMNPTIRNSEYIIRLSYIMFCFLKKVGLRKILWDGQFQFFKNLYLCQLRP